MKRVRTLGVERGWKELQSAPGDFTVEHFSDLVAELFSFFPAPVFSD